MERLKKMAMLCMTPVVFLDRSDLLKGAALACFPALGNLFIKAEVMESGIISLIGDGFFTCKASFTVRKVAGGAG